MADLVYKVGAEISDFERKMATISSKMQDMGKRMQKVGKQMSLYVTAPLTAMGVMAVKAFGQQEAAERKLGAAIRATGGDVEKNLARFKTFASDLQAITTVGDEVTLSMLQMAQTMGLNTEASERAVKNAIAMEAAFGVSAESAMRYTAALEQGDATMLKRYIPSLREITDESELAAKAQEILSNAFNVAKEDANTFTGQTKQLKNAFGDLMEQFGGVIAEAIKPLVSFLKSAVKWMQSLDERTKKIVVVVAGLAAAIGPLLIALGTLTSVIIPALVAGGTAIASAWLPITAIILGVVAAIKLFNMQQEKMNKQINQVAESGSLEELNNQLVERTKKLEELEKKEAALSASVRTQSRDFTPMDGMAVRTSTTESATELRKESGKLAAEITILKKAIELKQKQEEESNKITDEQLRLQKELEEKYKVNTEAINKNNEAVRQNLGEIPEKLETIKAASLGITTSLEQPFISLNKVLESFITISDTVAVRVRESFNQIGVKIQETRDVIIDVGKELSYLATDSLISIAESIGEAFGGGKMKDGLNKFLITLADWAQKFGGMLIAAGVASEAFQKSLAVNPLLAVGAGIALIAAASAVKGALASRPGARDSGGSRGGGGSIGRGENLEGMRGLYGLNVTVTGEIVADGSQLRTVIRNDEVRESY